MLTKPGQPLSPKYLSCKLLLPVHAAPHKCTASPLPLPASQTVGGETKEAETGLCSQRVKAQEPVHLWGQPSEEASYSCLSFIVQSGLLCTGIEMRLLWHELSAEEWKVTRVTHPQGELSSTADLVQYLGAQGQA